MTSLFFQTITYLCSGLFCYVFGSVHFIFLNKAINNGNPFTNIIYAVNVTNLWRTKNNSGIGMYSLSTHVGLIFTDFPISPMKFGPGILSVLVMCSNLRGQFSKSVLCTMFLNSASNRWPTLACTLHANIAASSFSLYNLHF